MHAIDWMQNSNEHYEGFFSQIQCRGVAEAAMRSSRNAPDDTLSIARYQPLWLCFREILMRDLRNGQSIRENSGTSVVYLWSISMPLSSVLAV